MATPRKKAAPKPAPVEPEAAVEPQPEQAVEPAPAQPEQAVDPVDVGEPVVEIVDADGNAIAEVTGDGEASAVTPPATAPIDAPAEPEPKPDTAAGLNVPGRIDGAEGQAATEMVVNANSGPSQEYINGVTGEPVDPDAMFELEFAHGSTYKTKVRLVERLYYPGQIDFNARIVFGIGARYNAADVARLTAHILAVQAAQVAQSETAEEIGANSTPEA